MKLKILVSRDALWIGASLTATANQMHPLNALALLSSQDIRSPSGGPNLWTDLQTASFPNTYVGLGDSADTCAFYLYSLLNGTPNFVPFRIDRIVHRLGVGANLLLPSAAPVLLTNGIWDTDAAGAGQSQPVFSQEPTMLTMAFNPTAAMPVQVPLESLAALYANGEEANVNNVIKRERWATMEGYQYLSTMVEMRGPNRNLPPLRAAGRSLNFKANPFYTLALDSTYSPFGGVVTSHAQWITEYTVDVDDNFVNSAGGTGDPLYAVMPNGAMQGVTAYMGYGSGGDYIFSPTCAPTNPFDTTVVCVNINDAINAAQGLTAQYAAIMDAPVNTETTAAILGNFFCQNQLIVRGAGIGGDWDAINA